MYRLSFPASFLSAGTGSRLLTGISMICATLTLKALWLAYRLKATRLSAISPVLLFKFNQKGTSYVESNLVGLIRACRPCRLRWRCHLLCNLRGHAMTSIEFRNLLEKHGLSQMEFARLAKADPRLVRRWADKRRAHPLTMGAEMRIRMALQSKGISSKAAP